MKLHLMIPLYESTLLFFIFLLSGSLGLIAQESSADPYQMTQVCDGIKNQKMKMYCLDSLIQLYSPNQYFQLGLLHELKSEIVIQDNTEKALEYRQIASDYHLKSNLPESTFEYVNNKTTEAFLNSDMGNYSEAEKILIALEKYVNKNAKNNPKSQLTFANTYGLINGILGRNQESLDWALVAIDHMKIINPEDNEDLAMKYSNLGLAYKNVGDLKNSEKYLRLGREMLRKFRSKDDLSCLLDTYNLGAFYLEIKEPQKAFDCFDEAVKLLEAHDNINYTELNYFLNGRGAAYNALGKFKLAIQDFERTLSICQDLFKNTNSQELQIISNLSNNLYEINDLKAFDHYSTDALKKYCILLKKNLQLQTADDLLDFNNYISQIINPLTILQFQSGVQSSEFYNNLFNIQLLLKGLGLEREISLNKKLIENENENVSLNYGNWKQAKQDLEQIYLQTNDAKIIAAAEANVYKLKKEIYLEGFDEELFDISIDLQKIVNQLPEKSIAIEFGRTAYKDSIFYYALLAKPTSQNVDAVRLFNESEIADRLNSDQNKRKSYVNRLYESESRGIQIENSEKNLKELILDPLLPFLDGIEKIYFAPDGLLHRINFGAIALNDFEVLNDKFELYQLGSSRKLVRPEKERIYENTAILIGGLDYDFEAEPKFTSRGTSNPSAWSNLKFTKREIDKIGGIYLEKYPKMDLTIIDGANGVEQNLRRLSYSFKSPRVIHIATHGFFLEYKEDAQNPFEKIKNPMMRSGIVLSGGNKGWLGQNSDLESDNILTASEIADLNLNNTELIVLSACETGLGDIGNSEGVFGLQRAFKIAGAKYIIMSLWQVPDRETSAFMEQFYENWLNEEMTIPKAFNQTQKQMRDRFFDPYQWAGFVLIE